VDLDRKAIALCVEGTQAEFKGCTDDARRLYREAWDCSTDDYEKCVAAHYVAHLETDPNTALRWNLAALTHAQLAEDELVATFFPSLYVNLGHCYELTGDSSRAALFYGLAAELGLVHQP
jgi:hypothetical protein